MEHVLLYSQLRKLIDLVHYHARHDVKVSTITQGHSQFCVDGVLTRLDQGVWMERVLLYSHIKWSVICHLKKCKELGLEVIEISAGFYPLHKIIGFDFFDRVHSKRLIVKPDTAYIVWG